jgi:hypothetical protein
VEKLTCGVLLHISNESLVLLDRKPRISYYNGSIHSIRTKMIFLLIVILIIPVCAIAVWFVLANKASDERYEREIERIYGRKR